MPMPLMSPPPGEDTVAGPIPESFEREEAAAGEAWEAPAERRVRPATRRVRRLTLMVALCKFWLYGCSDGDGKTYFLAMLIAIFGMLLALGVGRPSPPLRRAFIMCVVKMAALLVGIPIRSLDLARSSLSTTGVG